MARVSGIHTKQLDTAERQRIRTLYFDAQMGPSEIVKRTGFTKDQVRNAIRAKSATPAPRSGRPRKLNAQQEAQLVEYIVSSKAGRRASFLELSVLLLKGQFGAYAIRATLRRLGFKRYIARRKPPITEETRQKRLAWAHEYVNWTVQQWRSVLWSDETWIMGGYYKKQYVTRRHGEEWDPTCIIERHQRKQGWMFWGCFAGDEKGPGLLWEKDWGTISAATYQQHTVPLIDMWINICRRTRGQDLILMQDGAPSHSAASTLAEFQRRGVRVLPWPPYSPDLNPIEACWNKMKNYIEDKYGLIEKPSWEQLRAWVMEAWNALPEGYLWDQLATMPDRCRAVIEANGMHIKY
ncbi:uncharacterized protein CTRU02_209064 [Colletotrichum truncatum]|uniref:Uncharacterized protein n=1 Tax=Colletotrichum truncatum TaxID=5467 RepID=A0ACC3YY06_COLTU|nr:uncharacterized protein CTRU02_07745 [Colletotrichum truncatum]KAF6790839.1 hypothetical protein CTRU02_07745 [Colletotrichum truncatum]